jgi:SEC-C motif-containing protein
MHCPCNPTKKYIDCCQKIHENIFLAITAEQLMRSRYSAFVFGNIDYLQKSHHSSKRPNNIEKKEILKWTKSVEWIKLEVIKASGNTVAFKACFLEKNQEGIIHENSFFVKENNHWTYLEALI